MGRLLQHHPHAAAAKTDRVSGEYLPLHVAVKGGDRYGKGGVIKASCEVIGMILAAHPQVRTAQPHRGAS